MAKSLLDIMGFFVFFFPHMFYIFYSGIDIMLNFNVNDHRKK